MVDAIVIGVNIICQPISIAANGRKKYMKNYITEETWKELETVLMKAEVPYRVEWDSHWDGVSDTVTYDKYIVIEPAVVQKEVKRDVIK